MNYRLLILGLAFSSLAFAQKREMRKLEKAIESRDYEEVSSILSEINVADVESKYEAEYNFYKAVDIIGDPTKSTATGSELIESINLIDKAKEMGFTNEQLANSYQQAAKSLIFAEAQEMLKSNDQEGALEKVSYLVKLNPENQSMRENAANLAYRLGDFESAVLNYEKLIDEDYTGVEETYVATNLETNEVEAFPNKKAAEFAVMSNQFKDVKVETSESKLGPLVTNLIWIYQNNDDKEKGKELFARIQKKYPDDESLNFAKADIYLLLGMNSEYEDAISQMNEEIKDPKVYEKLGRAAEEKKNWDQAIEYYEKSIELDPNSYVTQNNVAAAYIQKGNLEETTAVQQKEYYMNAAKHYEKVLELKPDMDSAKTTLISIYKAFKMDDKAAALEASN